MGCIKFYAFLCSGDIKDCRVLEIVKVLRIEKMYSKLRATPSNVL